MAVVVVFFIPFFLVGAGGPYIHDFQKGFVQTFQACDKLHVRLGGILTFFARPVCIRMSRWIKSQ